MTKLSMGIASYTLGAAGMAQATNFEIRSLAERACDHNVRARRIAFGSLVVSPGSQSPFTVRSGHSDISKLDLLIIRGTRGFESAAGALSIALAANGAVSLDGPSRDLSAGPSKVNSTLNRQLQGVGTASLLLFGRDGMSDVVESIDHWLPVLVKPVAGHLGSEVRVLQTRDEVHGWLAAHWASSAEPALIQRYIEFRREWRVMLLWGRSLGVVEKHGGSDTVAKNVAAGGTFELPRDACQRVEDFAVSWCPSDCFLGVDLAEDTEGNIHLIEANYAPQFGAFQAATGVDVADEVIKLLVHVAEQR